MTALGLLGAGFALSFALGLVLVRSEYVRLRLVNRRDDLAAMQALHRSPTPRLGGAAVLAGFALGALLATSRDGLTFTLLLLLSGLPVVMAGLLEDIGHRVSPMGRLMAAGVSALLGVALMAAWIPPSGIAVVDLVFSLPALAILFTVVWVAGVCHGFNLIDGLNGLAAGLAAVIATGLAVLAWNLDETSLAIATLALLPAVMGFLVLNWPRGLLFLGDAGAYGLGFFLVWFAILLAWNVPDVSTAALSLMFFWPVADTFLAMGRRKANGRRFDIPDRLHFHQMIYRLLSRALTGRADRVWINSLAGACTLLLASMPVATAVLLWDRPQAALVAWGLFGLLFLTGYRLGLGLLKDRRRFPAKPRAGFARGSVRATGNAGTGTAAPQAAARLSRRNDTKDPEQQAMRSGQLAASQTGAT